MRRPPRNGEGSPEPRPCARPAGRWLPPQVPTHLRRSPPRPGHQVAAPGPGPARAGGGERSQAESGGAEGRKGRTEERGRGWHGRGRSCQAKVNRSPATWWRLPGSPSPAGGKRRASAGRRERMRGDVPAGDRDGGDSGRQTTALTPARLRGRRHGGGARGAASPGRPAAPRPRGQEEEEEDELTCHS